LFNHCIEISQNSNRLITDSPNQYPPSYYIPIHPIPNSYPDWH